MQQASGRSRPASSSPPSPSPLRASRCAGLRRGLALHVLDDDRRNALDGCDPVALATQVLVQYDECVALRLAPDVTVTVDGPVAAVVGDRRPAVLVHRPRTRWRVRAGSPALVTLNVVHEPPHIAARRVTGQLVGDLQELDQLDLVPGRRWWSGPNAAADPSSCR